MATLEQLEAALVKADAAGDTAAARTLAGEIQRMRASEAPSTGEDVARSGLSGLMGGVESIMSLPGMAETAVRERIVSPIAEKLGIGQTAIQAAESQTALPTKPIETLEQTLGTDFMGYEPQTTAGEYAQTIGEFAPGMAAGPGGILSRAAGNVVIPALASEAAGQITEGSKFEPLARLTAAVTAPMAAGAIGRRMISPFGGADDIALQQADILERAGVPVTAGQRVASRSLRALEDSSAPSEEQLEAFTRAALRSIGSNSSRATADVLDDAAKRIGSVFDDVTQNLQVSVPASAKKSIDDAVATYQSLAPTGAQAPVISQVAQRIDDAISGVRPIDADELMTWRSRVSKLTTSSDAATRTAAQDALETLDDVIEGSLTAAGRVDDVARLAEARRQYRDFLAIENAASRATTERGILTPAALESSIRTQSRSQLARGGRGDIGELASAAGDVLKPTPAVLPGGLRAIQGTVPAIGGAAGFATGGLPGAVMGALAPSAAQRLMQTRPAQAYLANQLIDPTVQRLTTAQRMLLGLPAVGASQR